MHTLKRGSITLLVLVFGGIFLTILMALSSYVLTENSAQDMSRVRAEAFSVAEAGLEYYRWHLAHFPGDLQNGTGAAGPYSVDVPDPSGSSAGTAKLSITANTACNLTTSIDIASTGTVTDGPTAHVTLVARYAQTSVAAYSYIVNSSVWAGADRVINGPYHSNGGVRMDGSANAPVTSSLANWLCTTDFGCTTDTTEPGVFGAGGNADLWNYPTPQLDFAGIASNFSSLKATAQSSGIYLPRTSSGNNNSAAYHKGYHLMFNANGTVTVTTVTSTQKLSVHPVNASDGVTDYALVKNENAARTYTIPSGCGLIFVEDNTWIDGVVPAKVTVVTANVTNAGVTPDVFLKGNITYAASDGSDGLTVISAHDILITPDAPDNMQLNGIFVAQGGAFGRNLYLGSNGYSRCDSRYEPKGTLTILGSTVSNKRTGTQWENGCGTNINAGFLTRIDSFDRSQLTNPPPFTPTLSTDYRFVDWKQVQ